MILLQAGPRLPVACFTKCSSDHLKRRHAAKAERPLIPDNSPTNKLSKFSRRSLLTIAPTVACGCGRCQSANATSRNAFLDQVFAQSMFTGMQEYEQAIAPVKQKLFSQLQASDVGSSPLTVLEIGAGTGPNLPYYQKESTQIIAVDPNNYMLPYLRQNLDVQGWNPDSVEWKAGIAENLPLEDASVDAVVCTLVLCSVSDVGVAIAEVRRVLRPGGKFLFIEHTTAALQQQPVLWAMQRAFNPLQRLFADGCNLVRDPLGPIDSAGFKKVDAMRFEVEGMSLIAPHVAGIATL